MKRTLFALAALGWAAGHAWADVPKTINYQGRLTNLAGDPKEGTYSITISLYADPDGNTLAWRDVFSAPAKNGYFNVVLGAGSQALNIDFSIPYYVGIRVDTDPEMTPRQPLSSVPYALGVPEGSIIKQFYSADDNITVVNSTNNQDLLQETINLSHAGTVLVMAKLHLRSVTATQADMSFSIVVDGTTPALDSTSVTLLSPGTANGVVLFGEIGLPAGNHNVKLNMTGVTITPGDSSYNIYRKKLLCSVNYK